MMKNNYWGEIVFSIVLVVLAILLINPFMIWMPTALFMAALAVFTVIFLCFAGFVWKESSGDEREDLHKLAAGRAAFLMGTGVLTLGIIVESFYHTIDPWLVAALTVMVLGKIAMRTYRDKIN